MGAGSLSVLTEQELEMGAVAGAGCCCAVEVVGSAVGAGLAVVGAVPVGRMGHLMLLSREGVVVVPMQGAVKVETELVAGAAQQAA